MPTLARLSKCRLVMHPRDHPPPHVHIFANDGSEAVMHIVTLDLISGVARPAVIQEARIWAGQNQELLIAAWKAIPR
jgi:hypothetical protein